MKRHLTLGMWSFGNRCHGWNRNLYDYWYRSIDSGWPCPDYFSLDFSRLCGMSAIFFAEFASRYPSAGGVYGYSMLLGEYPALDGWWLP
ncbi:MAG: hypothetical protein ACLUMQ_07710 [Streptococcus salivarius]